MCGLCSSSCVRSSPQARHIKTVRHLQELLDLDVIGHAPGGHASRSPRHARGKQPRCVQMRRRERGGRARECQAKRKNVSSSTTIVDVGPCLLVASKNSISQQEAFAEKPLERKAHGSLDASEQSTIGFVCQKGLKLDGYTPVNQDNFFMIRVEDARLFGVFDGHGPHGHNISGYVTSSMPKILAMDVDFNHDTLGAFGRAFPKMQAECVSKSQTFDCRQSGTTATILALPDGLSPGSTLCVAHVGDSRAVLATSRVCEDSGAVITWQSMDLTQDHRPLDPVEQDRILANGGVVRKESGYDNGRVFVRNQLAPGLAMSRSLGDTLAASVGVSCEPSLQKITIQADWRFIIVCSDGIWEFISSQEAVEIVGRFPPREAQAGVEALAQEARKRWQHAENSHVDDITVLCVWLDHMEQIST